MIEIILQRNVDSNRISPFFSEAGSAWNVFLRSWARQPWVFDFEPDTAKSLSSQRTPVDRSVDTKDWPIARILLEKGAHIIGNCCLAAGRHEGHVCRLFSVWEILEACVPPTDGASLIPFRALWEAQVSSSTIIRRYKYDPGYNACRWRPFSER